MKKLILLIILHSLQQVLFAQDKELDSLQSLLNIARHDTTQFNAYMGIGKYFQSNKPDTAIYFYTKARDVAEKIPGPDGELRKGEAINANGAVFSQKSDYQKALTHFDEAISIAQKYLENPDETIETKAKKLKVATLGNSGMVYSYQSDYTKALEYYFKSLKINEEIGDKSIQASILQSIGNVYTHQCDYPKALDYYFNALKINEEVGDKKRQSVFLGNIGSVYQNQSDYQKALEYYFKALKIKEELGDKRSQAITLGNIGLVYSSQANYPTALNYYFKALRINEETGNKRSQAFNLRSIGMVYYAHFDYPKALDYYFKALKINNEMGAKAEQAFNLKNIGSVYAAQSDYPNALNYGFKALKINEEIGAKSEQANTLAVIGWVYKNLSELTKALDYYLKSSKINEEVGEKSLQAQNLEEIGIIYTKLLQYTQAETCLKQAEKINRELGTTQHLKNNCFSLSVLYEKTGKYKDALAYRKEYIDLKDSLFNEENTKKLTRLEMQYIFDKEMLADSLAHAAESQVQIEKFKRQQIFTYTGIGSFLLVSFILLLLYRNLRQKQISNRALAIAKERAEQSEKFKQQFLANMSHEIRTPMNAVMGMTDLLIEKNPRSDQFNYLDGIKNSSATLLYIINDILDISKIEAGKIELEQIDFSIQEVVEQVKQTLHHKAQENEIQLIVDMDSKIPDVVIGDPVRLNQVLMNLTGNAIKFTEKGSVTLEVTQSEAGIKFSVIDTGVGIPKDKIQSVFESFTQAHSSDTRKFGGTGLGLTISKQLVELMGGKISIESEPGAGSIFSFEINYAVGSAERMQEQKSPDQIDGSILNGLKILLTDDNEYNRIVARDTLKSKANVEITEAVNGEDAIEKCSQKEFDVILMDVQMPVMDGFEATRYIRKNFTAPKNQIPVIAITASVIRSDLDKCRAAGMNDYVSKPFKASQLISAIAKGTGREIKFLDRKHIKVKSKMQTGNGTIDLSHLEEFCEGDKVRMQKYINIFLESAPLLIEKLSVELKENNFEEIASQVHSFKTKFVMMGMDEVKDLAATLEIECRKEAPEHETIHADTKKLVGFVKSATEELSYISMSNG